jgi:hippurate hydrolase
MEKERTESFKGQLTAWRRQLHEYPESAFEEVQTAAFLEKVLRKTGLDVHTGIGKTGIVANLTIGDGTGVIGLRADMDAICMEEKNNLPWRSKNPNRMHACGHDGHMTMLLGAAQLLAERKNFSGTVRFIFQPAEEPGYGARAMLEDGLFEKYPMDEIYGLHNEPNYPTGMILTRKGGVMASEDDFTIRITGKGSHASCPHLGKDPLVIAAEIILALQTVISRNVPPTETAVISCTELFTDGVRNAIPTHVEIKGDTRSLNPAVQALLEEKMRVVAESICHMNGASCEFIYTHEFTPTVNHDACVRTAMEAAGNIAGPANINADCPPFMGAEDFGLYLQKIPGCFVFLGTGKETHATDNTPLHNACYDFNDAALTLGAQWFAEIVRIRLGK